MRGILSLLVLFALAAQTSCEHHKEAHHKNLSFAVTTPLVQDTFLTKDYVAQIKAHRRIELRAMERGYLQHIAVDEGQHLEKGQQMFHVMPNIYKADLQKAKAEAEIAKIEYENTKLLADGNVVSPNELALAKAAYNKAQAEVALATTHLGFTDVKAPFSGIMDHLHVREGSLLEEGELLTTLSDNSQMWVYFNVPEAEYLDYITHLDEEHPPVVQLQLANGQLFSEQGVVKTIEGEFNNETGNIAFRATFDNPNKVLRHGETGSVLMQRDLKQVMLIPQKATFQVLDKKYVFVVDDHGTVSQREIQIADELDHLFVVAQGLKTTDHILLEGIRMVREGDHISPQFEVPQKVISKLELYAE